MTRTRTLLGILALQLIAAAALAQSAPPADEFGRASGGALELITKAPRQFSGTLSLSRSLGGFGGNRYEGSLGGTAVNDRVWFFAAASVLPQVRFATADAPAGLDVKATAQPVDWTTISASFNRMQQPLATTATPQANYGSLPSSFFTLRSTSMLNERMTLDLSVSQRRGTSVVAP